MNDDRQVLRVASDVADERRVNWDSEAAPGRAGAVLRNLRVIERIRSTYREASSGSRESPGAPWLASAADTDTVASSAVPGRIWGRLSILERIGGGGFGEVYRAHDPILDKVVALKLIRGGGAAAGPAERQRFLEEARQLARVRHPNVLTVHGADLIDGEVGLWTDLIEGETLEERLERQGPSGPEEAALVGIDVCAALAAVHAAGLVHRDVKTKNVMRAKGGRTILLDFSAVEDRTAPRQGSTTGTLHYMAPESLRRERATPATDIYALGVLLYRIVSGRHPIEGSDTREVLDRILRGDFRPLRDVRADLPPPFAQVIERALALDPAARYPSAGAMERALAASVGIDRAEASEPGAKPRWRRLAAAALLPLVAAGLVTGWLLMGRHPETLTVEATLLRSASGGEERLQPGATVHVGDRIAMEVRASRPFYLYVFNQDRNGILVLHPLPGMGATNPLSAGTTYRLPGTANARRSWEVTTEGGQESILAIGSSEPLSQLEETIRKMPSAAAGSAPREAGVSAAPLLRGLGAVVDDPSLAGEARFSDLYLRLYEAAARTKGLWVWQITVKNEGRASSPAQEEPR